MQQSFKNGCRDFIMELDDPMIQSVIIYMYRHPGGVDLEELVGSEKVDEVTECLCRYGMIKTVD